MEYKLHPSILAADFKNLGADIESVVAAGADGIHIDVMDGDFVPQISFGMPLIKSIRSATDVTFDVHLMVTNPERYIETFVECGADIVTIHAEATRDVENALKQIRRAGVKVGLALNPGTSLSTLDYIIDDVDMVLLMTVNPGFGGQKYIEKATRKIKALRAMAQNEGRELDIEVDGGVIAENLNTVLEAGANIIVMGSAIFNGKAADNTKLYKEEIRRFLG
ncbi:MAG: ribulose-phosphate 3-epimerase [Lachnospiraceae bacterium]|nr:ribulose-phosphate 3-epimerase [Lachnospiraceae bacterium]